MDYRAYDNVTTLLAIAENENRSPADRDAALPATSLAEAFEFSCARFGDRIALTAGERQITYSALKSTAVRVAEHLRALPLETDSLVAIYMDRSIEMVAAMLGVVLAGAAYLPLDPNHPQARIRETLADATPIGVITTREKTTGLHPGTAAVFVIDEMLSSTAPPTMSTQPHRFAAPHDLAYVIYTSGSTGKPKGVMVTHHNVLRLFESTHAWFNFDEHDVWTMFHSFAFDFSVWEIWGPLLTGGRLVIVPHAVSRSPEDFYKLLCAEGVTVLNQTPTAFNMLIQAEPAASHPPLALRLIILGGEALNLRALQPWFARHGDATPQVVNMYGITETTVHVTYRRVHSTDAARETDSVIGEPISDLTLHLLDDSLTPVADGDAGEICVGGAGVARGYLKRPELSAERFIVDPFASDGARMYRSGDIARRRADGELVYLGRADRQVKINGFRIEPGEIEAVLTTRSGVSQVCVTTHADAAAGTRLVAYIVLTGAFDEAALRAFAERHLPSHMRPALYIPLASLPINANGKVDRDALPPPVAHRAHLRENNVLDPQKSKTELAVANIWRDVLQVDSVTVDDNFFDVGGTSLLLIALRSQVQEKLQRAVPVTWLFEHASIRSFAARLDSDGAASAQQVTAASDRAALQRASFQRARSQRSVTR